MLRPIYRALSALLIAALTPACIASTDAEEDQDVGEQSATLSSTTIPDALAVPAGNHLAFTLEGRGDQVYGCSANAAGVYAWTLIGPDATLYTRHGCVAGSHYTGPTWEALDGSTVVGSKLAAVTVDATAVPWLLLGATSHAGNGRMTKVTFIQRVHTTAGLPPTTGCDSTHAGATAAVQYSATYRFFEADCKH